MQEQIVKIKEELSRRKLKQSSLAAKYRKLTKEQIADGEDTVVEKEFKKQTGAREALEWVLSVLQPNSEPVAAIATSGCSTLRALLVTMAEQCDEEKASNIARVKKAALIKLNTLQKVIELIDVLHPVA